MAKLTPKEFYNLNRERLQIIGREYYKNNHDKCLNYYYTNRDKINTKRREQRKLGLCKSYNKRNLLTKDQKIKNYLLKYKITVDQFNQLILNQNNKCYICKSEFTEKNKYNIDHNHATGQVRSILCHHCNSGLGYFRENINSLYNAVSYLKKFN